MTLADPLATPFDGRTWAAHLRLAESEYAACTSEARHLRELAGLDRVTPEGRAELERNAIYYERQAAAWAAERDTVRPLAEAEALAATY